MRRIASLAASALAVLLLVSLDSTRAAALPQWTWLDGPKTVNTVVNSGGSARPGARADAATALDAQGRMYVFGGQGIRRASFLVEPLNDLWRFNGTTWDSLTAGSTLPSYVAIGSPGHPGTRRDAVLWVDAQGEVWLFGGLGTTGTSSWYGPTGPLSDLWRFSGGVWTWMGGSNAPADSGSATYPSSRYGASVVRDSTGVVWMFGGSSVRPGATPGSSVGVTYSDLWSFDGSTWTLRSGTANMGGWGIYGTKGVPEEWTHPGGRSGAALMPDHAGGLWLFGGVGYDAGAGSSFLNDLWRFDGSRWTWVSGSQFGGSSGTWGTKGVPSPLNQPPGGLVTAAWSDAAGDVWLFGQGGNSHWVFDGGWWTWVGGAGSAAFGVYGTQGVMAPTNVPGSRTMAAAEYVPGLGVRLFGGNGRAETGSGYLADMWTVQNEVPARVGIAPSVSMVVAPAEGDTVPYKQYFRWSGTDIDGTIDHFEFAVDPKADPPDTQWVWTARTDMDIFFWATQPVEPVTSVSYPPCVDAHTLVVRAVDDAGNASNRLARGFVASNAAPSVWFVDPVPDPSKATHMVVCRFSWDGADPDGYFTRRPVKYKYRLFWPGDPSFPFSNPITLISQYPDTLRHIFGPNYALWDSISGDTTAIMYSNLTPGQDYVLCVAAADEAGAYTPRFRLDQNVIWFRGPMWIDVDESGASAEFALGAPTPNPARGSCSFTVGLPKESRVRLDVFDALGRRVRRIVDRTLPPGRHHAVWDLADGEGHVVPAGLYFLRLEDGGHTKMRRVVVTH